MSSKVAYFYNPDVGNFHYGKHYLFCIDVDYYFIILFVCIYSYRFILSSVVINLYERNRHE